MSATAKGRLLVTGHRGYVGAVLVPMLGALGYAVVGADTDLYRGCDFGDARPDGIPVVADDVRPAGCRPRRPQRDPASRRALERSAGRSVRPDALEDSLAAATAILTVLEENRTFVNLQPKGEPQLGRRGLYPATGGGAPSAAQLALLWVLNLGDGRHALLDIAERSGLPFEDVRHAAAVLVDHGLLRETRPPRP